MNDREPEEWPWDDSYDVSEVECDHCGNVRPCRYTDDPFVAEVYPEDEPRSSWWCGTCWSNRKDEV